jgi:aspartate-semialdehyde dehydrogenase
MRELESQTRSVLDGEEPVARVLPHPIAFNVFSHNSQVQSDGYNDEEAKVMTETRKILGDSEIAVTATCIRVPVMRAHSESINLSLRKPLSRHEATDLLARSPGVELIDDWSNNTFPMPRAASGRDVILIGRVRSDASQSGNLGLNLFVCGDQLRKGAALNAVQIAELLTMAPLQKPET